MSLEESNRRINRLIAMHKKLSEANMASLPSQVEKRKRSTSAVNASNIVHISETDQTSSPTPISPVHKVEALICSQSWLQTSQRKLSEREAAEEVQAYEEIREGIVFAIEEKCRLMCVKLLITPFLFFIYRVCFKGLH